MTFVTDKFMEVKSKLDLLKYEYEYNYLDILRIAEKLAGDDKFCKSKECKLCNATEYYLSEIEMAIHNLKHLCERHEELKELISKEEEAN